MAGSHDEGRGGDEYVEEVEGGMRRRMNLRGFEDSIDIQFIIGSRKIETVSFAHNFEYVLANKNS